jgi:hypothetical protein
MKQVLIDQLNLSLAAFSPMPGGTLPGQRGSRESFESTPHEAEPTASSLNKEAAFTFRWHDTIDDLSTTDWEACFSSERFSQTHSYQQAVEASAPRGVHFQYLMVYQGSSLLGIVGCFRYRVPLSTLSTGALRKVMSGIERFLPNLFSINGFFVGQLTAVCDHLYGLKQIPTPERSDFLRHCDAAVTARARSLGAAVIIHKEIPQQDLSMVTSALGESYLYVPSLPAMELALESDEPFQQQLRKKYRNHYRRRQALAKERGLTWDVHRGPIDSDLSEEMEALYLQVLERSGTQFERLSSSFFSSMLKSCPGSSLVLCKDGERLVGFMLNVEAQDAFHGLYLGYDVSYRDAAVYFNLIYQSIEVAQAKGYRTIHLGQSSYEIKSALGAKRSDLHLALRASNPLVHAMLQCFRNDLFPEIDVPVRRAFPLNR